MSGADFAAGFVALALTLLSWAFSASLLRARLLPDWLGAAGALVTAAIGVSGVLVTAEVLGVVGGFARWTVAGASVTVAGALRWLLPPPSSNRRSWDVDSAAGRSVGALLLAAVCAASVSAALVGRDAQALRTGPDDLDALHYHLSESAFFVHTHSIAHLHQTAPSDASVYYPLNGELLDAVAMLGPHPDIATFGLNLVFGWLALLACWVIGARWRVGHAAVAAGSSMLALPLIIAGGSGPGLNDIPALAGLLAAVAILVHAEGRSDWSDRWLRAVAAAGLALGFAGGTKLSLLGVVVLLGLATVVLAPTRRILTAGVVTVAALATGGFWFVRDWIAVGSPVPSVQATIGGHGFHQVPYPEIKPVSFAVAHYLGDWTVIRHTFVPDLKLVATPAWPLIAVLVIAGIALGIAARGERIRQVLAVVSLLGVGVYLVTPNTALGPPGHPTLFGANLRYLVPVLILAVVLLVTAKPFRRFSFCFTVGFTILTLSVLRSQVTGAVIDRTRGVAIVAALVAAVGLAGFVAVGRRPRQSLTLIVASGLAVSAGTGAVVQHRYLKDRYAGPDPRAQLFAWADGVHDQRIGVVGFPLQYPFYSPRLDNTVQYVGVSAPDHSFAAPRTCAGWTHAVSVGHYDYLVIQPSALENTIALTRFSKAFGPTVLSNSAGTVIRLDSTIPDHCGSTPSVVITDK